MKNELKDILKEMTDIVKSAKTKIDDIPDDDLEETLEAFTEALHILHRII